MRAICECGEPTDSITRTCSECRLIARNERMSGKRETGEPVSLFAAIELVRRELGGTVINDLGSTTR